MHIIICLDDSNGMLFNGRRLSSDRILCKRILELADGATLRMNAYSASLFPGAEFLVQEDFLDNAEPGDICFVENVDLLPYMERVHTMTVCYWNRSYPSDVKFAVELIRHWKVHAVCEYAGSSHERITEVRYIK